MNRINLSADFGIAALTLGMTFLSTLPENPDPILKWAYGALAVIGILMCMVAYKWGSDEDNKKLDLTTYNVSASNLTIIYLEEMSKKLKRVSQRNKAGKK